MKNPTREKIAVAVASRMLNLQRQFAKLMHKLVGRLSLKLQAVLMTFLLVMTGIYCFLLLAGINPINFSAGVRPTHTTFQNTVKKDSLDYLEHIYQSYQKP